MGYTHYIYRSKSLDKSKFSLAAEDCKKLITAAEKHHVYVAYEFNQTDKLPECNENMIRFNGLRDEGHETFYVEREYQAEKWEEEKRGKYFSFCKTAEKPYDLLVCACLIVLKHYFGNKIIVHSDGGNEDWKNARVLCQETLGYGEDFLLDKE